MEVHKTYMRALFELGNGMGRNATNGQAHAHPDTVEVEQIDYDTRKVATRTPKGELWKFEVAPEVKRFNEVKVGDLLRLQITEAVALDMLQL